MRKQLYIDISEALKDIRNENNEQVIRHIDLWNQQTVYISEEGAFDMPAVFIEFRPIAWLTKGAKLQEADIAIALHIVTSSSASARDGSSDIDYALYFLDIIDMVHKKLTNAGWSYTGKLTRTASDTDNDHADIFHNIETYVTRVYETNAMDTGHGTLQTITLTKNPAD